MKTTFGRLFSMIAVLLILAMLLTGVCFRFLMLGSMESEKRETLSANAANVASMASAYASGGNLADNWDFRLSLSLFSDAGGAEALICDESGAVCICSCEEFNCDHLGMTIPQSFLATMDTDGTVYEQTVLEGIYTEKRFLAGTVICAEETGEVTGYVLVSSPMTEVNQFLHRSILLFLYTALAAIAVAMGAASVLSRQMVRPLAKVADAAQRFGRGELETRVEVDEKSTQEVADLAGAFNSMAQSLEQSERRRQEFVANVSHELKTPMTTIGGYVDGMLDGTIPPEKQQHYMQIVSDEVRRLSRLVRNMLDITRLQAMGVEESRKVRFDLSEVLGDVLITMEQKITVHHLNVQVNLPDKAVWVRGERDSITQVIYNLLDNAVKFCPVGGRLALSIVPDGNKVRVTVENTGPTIDPAELPLLFDRFHKADKSRSSDREGWGLGLYIAKTIVGAHGGDIWATSENGVTQFVFTLPTVR